MKVTYTTTSGEQITLTTEVVKKYLVVGQGQITDQEAAVFIAKCKALKLNPFLGEIYLIKYSDDEPASSIVSKDFFAKRAIKNPLCKGFKAGIIVQRSDGQLIEREGSLVLPNEQIVGGWAEVYRKDWAAPYKNTVSFAEYCKYRKDGRPTSSWARIPATMIKKVALAQALRDTFPEEYAGIYSPEEIEKEPTDAAANVEEPIRVKITGNPICKERNNKKVTAIQAVTEDGEAVILYGDDILATLQQGQEVLVEGKMKEKDGKKYLAVKKLTA